jgi:hypothetical protein
MGNKISKRNGRIKSLDRIVESAAVAPLNRDLSAKSHRLESDRGSTCSEQPYQHHFGLTFLGIEYWGFNLVGTLTPAERRQALSVRVARDGQPSEEAPANASGGCPNSGLRVRVGKN